MPTSSIHVHSNYSTQFSAGTSSVQTPHQYVASLVSSAFFLALYCTLQQLAGQLLIDPRGTETRDTIQRRMVRATDQSRCSPGKLRQTTENLSQEAGAAGKIGTDHFPNVTTAPAFSVF